MKEKNDHIRTDIDLLEAYLAGTLPDPEKKVVAERLLSDQEFINLYDTLKTLPRAARRSHLESKRNQLLEIEERLREAEQSGQTPFTASAEASSEGPTDGEEAKQSGQTPFRVGAAGEIIGVTGEESGEVSGTEPKADPTLDGDSPNVQGGDKDGSESTTNPDEPSAVRDQPSAQMIRRWWMGVAAGVVILLGALFFMTDRRTEGEKLFDEYFEIYPPMLSRADDLSHFQKGQWYYAQQRFKEAIKEFRAMENQSTISEFYLGLSYMARDQDVEAEKILEEVATGNEEISAIAQYYYGLLLLKTKPPNVSQSYWERFVANCQYQCEKSSMILKSIEEL